MLRRAHRGTEFAARPKPFGASIFDNWMKRRIALHDTGRTGRGHQGHAGEDWEVREHSDGKRVVYVRFAPKEPTLTVNVKEG